MIKNVGPQTRKRIEAARTRFVPWAFIRVCDGFVNSNVYCIRWTAGAQESCYTQHEGEWVRVFPAADSRVESNEVYTIGFLVPCRNTVTLAVLQHMQEAVS